MKKERFILLSAALFLMFSLVLPFTGCSTNNVDSSGVPSAAIISGVISDSSGSPVPGARISLSVRSKNLIEDISDNQGRYVLQGVPFGTHTLYVERAGFQSFSSQIRVDADNPNPTLNVAINPAIPDTGVVAGVVKKDGSPVSGAYVFMGNLFAITNDQGEYSVKDVPAGGDLPIKCEIDGTIWSHNVEVNPGETTQRDFAVTLVEMTETVDTGLVVSGGTAIALDASGNPHIIYYDWLNDNAKYAYRDGEGWRSSTIINNCYPHSMVLDSSGYPHVTAMESGALTLLYAYQDENGWHIEQVDAGTQTSSSSLQLDSSGYPHIAYYDHVNMFLKYAYEDSTGWHVSTVDNSGDSGEYPDLALAPDGFPHVIYISTVNWDLKYAYLDAGGWRIETVDVNNVRQAPSITIDIDGTPRISYVLDFDSELIYAFTEVGAWNKETVQDTNLKDSSIALDTSGFPHMAYVKSGALMSAYKDSTGWRRSILDDTSNVNGAISMVLDESGGMHVSYFDLNSNNQKYYYRGYVLQP